MYRSSAFKIPPPAAPLTAAERDAIISAATSGLVREFDKMEKISFYSARGNFDRNERITAYIAIPEKGAPIFRILIRYFGDSWIFFNKVKIMSDDVISYDSYFSFDEVKKNNAYNSVWETLDFPARKKDIDVMRKIVSANKTSIRLAGNDRRDDHDLTFNEIVRIHTVLIAFDGLSKLGRFDF